MDNTFKAFVNPQMRKTDYKSDDDDDDVNSIMCLNPLSRMLISITDRAVVMRFHKK